jgi:hypothetical protein
MDQAGLGDAAPAHEVLDLAARLVGGVYGDLGAHAGSASLYKSVEPQAISALGVLSIARQTDLMRQSVQSILTNLEAVGEELLALSDDIWLSIDHNDNEALAEGVRFKTTFNEQAAERDR